jgi:hypothetical protein
MTLEQLMAQGLTEAQAKAVLKMHTDTIEGSFVPKHRFDEVNNELKTAKQQVTERDTQIQGLTKFEGDAKALQKELEDLKIANQQKDEQYKKEAATDRKKNAVKIALLEDDSSKPYDADMVMGLFNLDQIVIDETTGKIVSGLKEQKDNVAKEKPFLFQTKQTDPTNKSGEGARGWKPKGNNPPDGDNSGEGANDSESYGKSLAQIKLQQMGITPKADK